MLFTVVAIVVVVLIGLWVIVTYNKFISFGERVTNGKAQIATQIESRWDAVKSLIQATKQYAKHETDTLESIVDKRASVGKNSSIEELENDELQLNQTIGRLLAITESYPDLKASEVYQTSMEGIQKYEDNVRHSRMIYNDVVTKYNRLVKMIPSNIVALIFNFKEREYFQGTESKQEMPSWE